MVKGSGEENTYWSWIETRFGWQDLGALPKLDGGDMRPETNTASNTPPSTAYQQNQERGPEGSFEGS